MFFFLDNKAVFVYDIRCRIAAIKFGMMRVNGNDERAVPTLAIFTFTDYFVLVSHLKIVKRGKHHDEF